MALSDSEVEKQINHMKRFIEQEAQEKAEEILIKAEEEFNIEKGRLVQTEKLKISTYYERKEKQVELQKKIQHSNLLNQARLAVLKARDDHIKHILEEAQAQLGEISKNKDKYKRLLESLVLQGLYQLLESEVVIRCRKADVELVKSVLTPALKTYTTVCKKTVQVNVSSTDFLPSDCAGGVELLACSGKIKVTNTLESRLDLLSGQMLPEIRTMLFGPNPSRHFMD